MRTVIIAIHLMVVIALVVVVLLQRSEGGALGIGGGGGFLSGRGQTNALTRATAILGGIFFLTSIALTVEANINRGPGSLLEGGAAPAATKAPAGPAGQAPPAPPSGNLLDQLNQIQQQRGGGAAATSPSAAAPQTQVPGGTQPPQPQ